MTYDATTNSTNVSGVAYNTRDISHTTTSQTNRGMVVFVTNAGSSIASMTYDGVALTSAGIPAGSNQRVETWYLKNPSTGTNTLTINWTSTTVLADMTSISTFYGADPTTQPDDADSLYDPAGTTVSRTLTISEDNCIYFACVSSEKSPTLLDGETIVTSVDIGSAYQKVGYGFANTGSQTVSASGGSLFEINIAGIDFLPFTGSGFDPLLLLDNI